MKFQEWRSALRKLMHSLSEVFTPLEQPNWDFKSMDLLVNGPLTSRHKPDLGYIYDITVVDSDY